MDLLNQFKYLAGLDYAIKTQRIVESQTVLPTTPTSVVDQLQAKIIEAESIGNYDLAAAYKARLYFHKVKQYGDTEYNVLEGIGSTNDLKSMSVEEIDTHLQRFKDQLREIAEKIWKETDTERLSNLVTILAGTKTVIGQLIDLKNEAEMHQRGNASISQTDLEQDEEHTYENVEPANAAPVYQAAGVSHPAKNFHDQMNKGTGGMDINYPSMKAFSKDALICGYDPEVLLQRGEYVKQPGGWISAKEYAEHPPVTEQEEHVLAGRRWVGSPLTREAAEAVEQAGGNPHTAKVFMANDYEFNNIYSGPSFPHELTEIRSATPNNYAMYRVGDLNLYLVHVTSQKMTEAEAIVPTAGEEDSRMGDIHGTGIPRNPEGGIKVPAEVLNALKNEIKHVTEIAEIVPTDVIATHGYGDRGWWRQTADYLQQVHDLLATGEPENVKYATTIMQSWENARWWNWPSVVVKWMAGGISNDMNYTSIKDRIKDIKIKKNEPYILGDIE